MTAPQTVWVAAVDHKHGTTLYAAASEAGLCTQLAAYCLQWWEQEMPLDAPDPIGMTDREIVSFYFEYFSESGGDEWHIAREIPLAA
jgi:hypothetical protein